MGCCVFAILVTYICRSCLFVIQGTYCGAYRNGGEINLLLAKCGDGGVQNVTAGGTCMNPPFPGCNAAGGKINKRQENLREQ